MVELVITLNMEGYKQTLERLGVSMEELEGEVDTIADMVMEECKQVCPSPTSTYFRTNSTGNLRDSHQKTTLSRNVIRVAPTARYAVFVHMGTVNMRARPWLEMAVQNVQPQVQSYLVEKVRSAIQSAVASSQ